MIETRMPVNVKHLRPKIHTGVPAADMEPSSLLDLSLPSCGAATAMRAGYSGLEMGVRTRPKNKNSPYLDSAYHIQYSYLYIYG